MIWSVREGVTEEMELSRGFRPGCQLGEDEVMWARAGCRDGGKDAFSHANAGWEPLLTHSDLIENASNPH